MLHCLNTSGNLTAPETTISDMTLLQTQKQPTFNFQQFSSSSPQFMMAAASDSALAEVVANNGFGKDTIKKRKAETNNNSNDNNNNNSKVVVVNQECDKRIKVNAEEEESNTKGHKNAKLNNGTKRENSGDTNSKEKLDYIHVRARRGQATDSHSLAERVRREKISERMKYLQDLVPGCNKIAGKAGMLDEIINYVQSLQRQVEFLSMKLAAVNPRLDFNIDELFAKEVFPQNFPTIGMQSDMTNPTYLQFNSAQLVSSCGGLINNMGIIPPEIGLRRNLSLPTSTCLPEIVDSSCFNHILPSSTWEGDFQNLHSVDFDLGRSMCFPSQPFTGMVEASNLKMEM